MGTELVCPFCRKIHEGGGLLLFLHIKNVIMISKIVIKIISKMEYCHE